MPEKLGDQESYAMLLRVEEWGVCGVLSSDVAVLTGKWEEGRACPRAEVRGLVQFAQ